MTPESNPSTSPRQRHVPAATTETEGGDPVATPNDPEAGGTKAGAGGTKAGSGGTRGASGRAKSGDGNARSRSAAARSGARKAGAGRAKAAPTSGPGTAKPAGVQPAAESGKPAAAAAAAAAEEATTVQSAAVQSAAVESGAVESGAVESGAVESGAVESGAVGSPVVKSPAAVESTGGGSAATPGTPNANPDRGGKPARGRAVAATSGAVRAETRATVPAPGEAEVTPVPDVPAEAEATDPGRAGDERSAPGALVSDAVAGAADRLHRGYKSAEAPASSERLAVVSVWSLLLVVCGGIVGLRALLAKLDGTGTGLAGALPTLTVLGGLIGLTATIGAFLTIGARRTPWVLLGVATGILFTLMVLISVA
jgi:hypothetical protein